MNVDRRWWGAFVGRFRLLTAGLLLLAVAGTILWCGSRSQRMAANSASVTPSIQNIGMVPASPLAPAMSPEIKPTSSRAISILASLPLMFEPNQGQSALNPADARARFMARGSGYGLLLGNQGAILTLRSNNPSASSRAETLQMKLAGANPHATLTGADPLPGKSNYFTGSDPSGWHHNVPQFARVRYADVYPGINLVFYGNQGHLEYDFQVAPGSDPSQAELEFDGASHLALQDGSLVIHGEAGSVRLEAPQVYQQIAGRRQPVQGSFVLRGANRVGFALGAYDHSRELVIDPVLTFSSYFGGTGDEQSTSVAVDGGGNIYLTGSTTSPTLPAGLTTNVVQPNPAGTQNAYIAKINPIANPPFIQYVTYLGGTGPDIPVGIDIDGAGNAFVAGTTSSANFPTTTSAYQNSPLPGSTGTQHVFVSELKNDATQLLYSSYLSGNGDDVASGMTIDGGGNIYVTGTTTSNNPADVSQSIQFPASTIPQGQAFQPIAEAGKQFFVTKVNTQAPRSGSIAYSTYFGGANFNTADPVAIGGGIAVDSNGNVYFSGTTNFIYTGCSGCSTTDFPIKNAYQPCLDQAPPSVIVNPAVCSNTDTTSNSDAFIAKLNPNAPAGTGQLQWSTYLGGTQVDSGTGVALDSGAANVYLTGTTNSPDVTTITFASYQPCLDGPFVAAGSCNTAATATDAFVARFSNPASTTLTNMSLTYFSYLGGSADDAGLALTVDAASGAVVTGWTESSDFPAFPAANDIQSTYGGNRDAFLARLNTAAVSGQNTTGSWATYFGGSGLDQGSGVALDVNQNVYFAGDSNSTTQLSSLQPLNAGGFDAFVGQVSSAASLAITGALSLGTNQTYVSAGNQATFTYTLTNNGPDLATNITVTDDIRTQTTIVPVTFVSAAATSGTCSGGSTTTNITCNIQSLQSGSTATITIVLTPTASTSGTAQTFNGGTVVASGANNITPVQTIVSANMSDFAILVSPNNVSLSRAGDSATFQVQLTPHPVYSTAISLSVTGLPGSSSQSFTTPSVTLAGTSPGTSTLTISTTARPIVTPSASLSMTHFYAIWFSLPGMAIIGLGVGRDKHRRRIAAVLLLCFLSLLIVLQPACSHSTTQPALTGTPAGTYPLTVTATSGSDTKSYPITLTVP